MSLVKRARWFLLFVFLLAACASPNGSSADVTTGLVTSATIVDTVEGSGSITPRHLASLTWMADGTVGKILVQTGQRVGKGEVLAALSPDSLSPSILQAQVDLAEARRKLEELQQSKTAQAQAQLALANAQQALEEAQRNYYNVTGKRATSETIKNAEAQYALAMQKVAEAERRYEQYRHLPMDNPLKAQAYSALYAAWQARDRALATLNWYLGKPSETEVAKAEAALALARAQLEDAQREMERLKDGPDPNDIAAAEAAVQAAQNTVNSQYLLAPFDGEVIFINNEVGDVVKAGTLGIVLVDRSKLYVTVSIEESKIMQLKVGDRATATLEVLPDVTLAGQVVSINPLGTPDQGILYFDVRVQLDDKEEQVFLGATADVTIQIGEPQEVLAVPAAAIQSDAQGEFVYVVEDGGAYRRVEIVSGRILDDDRVVVTGDLRVGERVLLLSQTAGAANPNRSSEGVREPPGGGGFMVGP